MMSKKKVLVWIVFASLLAISILTKIVSPKIIEQWYSQGSFGILNKLTHASENLALEFYLGRIEEVFFGPISMLASGLAFLLISFAYLKKSSGKVFGVAVFLYLLITKFEILFFPPYGDSASGPFVEAIWLLRNNFDYGALAHQPNFVLGGPKVYLISIYPTFEALLLKFITYKPLFISINHLIVFAWAAMVIVYFRKILLKVCDENIALLMSFLLLAYPLFQSQAEQINMEMPMLLFAVLSMYFLSNKRIFLAAVFAMLAALVKGVGVAICLAALVMNCFLFLIENNKKQRIEIFFSNLLLASFVAIMVYYAKLILSEQGSVSLVGYFQGWTEMKRLAVPYLYAIACFLFLGKFLIDKFQKIPGAFIAFLKEHYVALTMFAAAGGWFVVFINSAGQMCRYRLLLLPFIFFCSFVAAQVLVKWTRVLMVGLFVLIILCFINAYGVFYTPHPISIHSALERSLEYRNDQKVQLRIAKEIEEKFSEFTIGAQFTIAQVLALPELGYVHKKLDVMIYEFPCTYGIRVFKGVSELDLRKTLWVGFEMNLPPQMASLKGYPVSPNDFIVAKIIFGNRQATLFIGGEYIEKIRMFVLQSMRLRKLQEYMLKQHN